MTLNSVWLRVLLIRVACCESNLVWLRVLLSRVACDSGRYQCGENCGQKSCSLMAYKEHFHCLDCDFKVRIASLLSSCTLFIHHV